MEPTKPDPAARCRALAAQARAATLCTISRDPAGWPYGSLVAVTFDDAGRALLLISRLAEHTGNLLERPEASLLVTAPGAGDPLAEERMTIVGRARRLDGAEAQAAKARFLAAHPEASVYADFPDFTMHAIEPDRVRYVGGFGRQAWVDGASLAPVK